jgi:hypothetical protein
MLQNNKKARTRKTTKKKRQTNDHLCVNFIMILQDSKKARTRKTTKKKRQTNDNFCVNFKSLPLPES